VSDLATELEARGGTSAPPAATARLRALAVAELDRGAIELGHKRSG
jgi:hypothetical protein